MKNKAESKDCGVTLCMSLIGGKWKPIILLKIAKGCNRFNKLINEVEGINRQMLSKQLREMTKQGLLERVEFGEIPPRVEYKLTVLGKSFQPVLQAMDKWGAKHMTPKTKPAKVVKPKDVDEAQVSLF